MSRWIHRALGILLIILLICSPELCSAMSGGENLPDSPGTLLAKQEGHATSPNDARPQQEQTSQPPAAQNQQQPTAQNQQSAPSQQNSSQPENGTAPAKPQSENTPQQPVGGAAAQLGRTTGGAASKPAGAALAPAKQRQTRSLLVKLGLIAGAGIAVGSVAALSHASPSRPPGTR